MGYDMHMVNKPKSVPEGYTPQYEGQPSYFRLNIRAMPFVQDAMDWAECLHYDACNYPDLPPLFQHNQERWAVVHLFIEYDEDELEGVPVTEEEEAAARAFLHKQHAAISASNIQNGCIPAYKFCSNEGWWVTPEECKIVVSKLRATLDKEGNNAGYDDDALQLLNAWIDFNALAAEHNGYRVN